MILLKEVTMAEYSAQADTNSMEGGPSAVGNGEKTCRVCDDKAFNINFNVLTCESCKAFFRRNALKPQDFHCSYNGQCEINVSTRRKCKKCRMQKCFEVGMLKEFIMTDDARLRKRQLIAENRSKRRLTLEQSSDIQSPKHKVNDDGREDSDIGKPTNSNAPSDVTVNSGQLDKPPADPDNIRVPKSILTALVRHCHQSVYNDTSNQLETVSDYNQNGFSMCQWKNGSSWDSDRGPPSPPSSEASKESTETTRWPRVKRGKFVLSKQDLMSLLYTEVGVKFLVEEGESVARFDFGLSASKWNHFELLRYAHRVLFDRWDDGFVRDQCTPLFHTNRYDGMNGKEPTNGNTLSLAVLIDRFDNLLRRLVKLCHRMVALKHLDPSDQVNLVKGCLVDIMLLQGVHTFVPQAMAWRHTDPLGPFTPVASIRSDRANVFSNFCKFLLQFPRYYVCDEKIWLSLFPLLIFTPDRPGVVDNASVHAIRAFYTTMLYQYLLSVYDEDTAKYRIQEISRLLYTIRQLAPRFVWKTVVELDPETMEPLLIDCFQPVEDQIVYTK